MKPRISVIINTLNEEQNLAHALRSVRAWVDQIVVVDMHSHDQTREIAQRFGAEVYLHERLGFVEPARAYALEKCVGDWVLVLDADELVPAELSRELLALAASGECDVVSVPRRNYLLGAALEHTGWNADRDRHERFFRRGKLELTPRIHRGFVRAPDARTHVLPFTEGHAIIHFNYTDFTQFIEKLNRYTSIEASQAFERGERAGTKMTLLRAAREFLRRYLILKGYRDGWRGLHLSAAMAFYRLATGAKLTELARTGGREKTLAHYAREAEAVLAGYDDAPPPRGAPAPRSFAETRAHVRSLLEPLGWFERERFPNLPTDQQATAAFSAQELVLPEWSEPEVSIIVPVYGKFATTFACLRSLAEVDAGRSFEVLVVDDCSPDQTLAMLERVRGVLVLKNAQNLGYLRSNNRAAKLARGKWLCLLNNDTQVTPGWLDELVRTFANFPDVGLVGAKLLFPDGRLQEAGGIVFQDGGCANYGRSGDPERPEYSYARSVDYCSAACVLLKSTLWRDLAGFDEHFAPAYYEDTDLAFRVREAGLRVMYQPLARIVHHHGVTHGRNAKHGLKRALLTNRVRFAERWAHVLREHPAPSERPRKATERGVEHRQLITLERALDGASLYRLLERTEGARTRGHVAVWTPNERAIAAAARAELQRHGIEVLSLDYVPNLGAALRSGPTKFDEVLRWDASEPAVTSASGLSPRAQHTQPLAVRSLQRDVVILAEAER